MPAPAIDNFLIAEFAIYSAKNAIYFYKPIKQKNKSFDENSTEDLNCTC
jgi:hypothetical protein